MSIGACSNPWAAAEEVDKIESTMLSQPDFRSLSRKSSALDSTASQHLINDS
jgi:hypothetical protein